jgi:site-specific DNA-methyltransferase (adenine-specific)
MPLKITEDVCVFYEKQPIYNPIKTVNPRGSEKPGRKGIGNTIHEHLPNCPKQSRAGKNYEADKLLPTSILEFSKPAKPIHPTQKPVALMEYLIKTYTNEGDLVLDNCAGSFTTAIAAENLKRNWICIEKEAKYCAIGKRRIEENRKRILALLDNIKIAEKRINEIS